MSADDQVFESFTDINLESVLGVLLDLDGTLYAYQPCHERGLEAAFAVCSFELDFAEYSELYRNARTEVTTRLAGQGACRSRLFAFQSMAERLDWQSPYTLARKLDRAYWAAFLQGMLLDAAALRFLQRCRERDIAVCMVTDMTAHVQIDKLERLDVLVYVDHLVTSEEIGIEKPSARMFEAGLKKLGLRADQVIMVGDDLEKDVQGARALGIKAFQVNLERGN